MISSISVRPMRSEDADAVRELDAKAFAPHVREAGRGDLIPLRTRENVLASLDLNPGGCFIAEGEGLVGFIFTRRWGAVGWLGTFGVCPDRQGQGIGRQLLGAAIAHLETTGCTVVGLETMPDSTYNIGLYARGGFRPAFPTVILEEEATPPVERPSFTPLSQVEDGAGLAAVTRISQAAWAGLDYGIEARNAAEYGWGETLLLGWPKPWAAAVLRTTPRRTWAVQPTADVSALVVHPQARQQLEEAVRAVEAFACERDLQQVRLPVNAADWTTLQQALAHGFRIVHVGLRMLLKGEYTALPGVDMSRWAM